MTHSSDSNIDQNGLELDDPRISAYAFDQMDDAERAAFEAQLAQNPAAQAEVAAIRSLGGDLEQAFAGEATLTLRPEQKAAIESAASVAPPELSRGHDWTARLVAWSAAALVLVGVGLLVSRGLDRADNAAPATETSALPSLSGGASSRAETDAYDAWSRQDIPKGDELGSRATVVPAVDGGDLSGFSLPRATLNFKGEFRGVSGGRDKGPVDGYVPGKRFGTFGNPPIGGGSGPVVADADLPEQTLKAVKLPPTTTIMVPPRTPGPAADPGAVQTGSGPERKLKPTPAEIRAAGRTLDEVHDGRNGRGKVASVRLRLEALEREALSQSDGTVQWRVFGYQLERKPEVVDGLRLYVDAVKAGNVKQQQVVLGRLASYGVPNQVLMRLRSPTVPQTGETFQTLIDNEFQTAKDGHPSTFSIDVDTASYTNVRRMLMQQGVLPRPDAVRIEEFINAFDYGYTKPGADAEHPLAMTGDVAGCPWNPDHRLARIALQAHDVGDKRPTLNLVFLIDVSGSMKDNNKLPLAQRGLSMLLESLRGEDRVGIVTYANKAEVRLESTVASEHAAIQNVINSLSADGSTNGEGGIQLAYAMARKHFIQGAANRVILLTDGDFNVGVSDDGELERLIAEKSKGGIDLSVLGFGMGNYKDGKLERLSNRGNGNYAYIDSLDEARKALVDDMLGTLVTVARDVKIQVYFNPRTVRQWRLIGYANRQLAAQDFNDDTKDAGEVGSGHSVTALYEIIPVGAPAARNKVDPNPFIEKEAEEPTPVIKEGSNALFQLRLRYKRPDQDTSVLVEADVTDTGLAFDKADDDFQFATAVAGFGLSLRNSRFAGGLSLAAVEEVAQGAMGDDPSRKEFVALVQKARALRGE